MSKRVQALRGMHDILPERCRVFQRLESTCRDLLSAYGYEEIRLPLVESTELFQRTIGEVTDIVEKEMYTFTDRNGDSLSLRPEGTAGCVRAGIEHGLFHNRFRRLWYAGPMFRHERPQKGRYRQFYQVGVETFGMAGPDIDAELICLTRRLWQALGLENLVLQINSLGSSAARAAYRGRLVDYFSGHAAELDEDSRRRLHSNPLRILDSKNPAMQPLIAGAPLLTEALDEESRRHFEALRRILDAAGVPYVVNPRLVRGLDYYCRTVFEWVSDRLGAQGTVCAGGRYDGLVEQLGGRATPAAGFALGVERLAVLMEEAAGAPPSRELDCYLIAAGAAARAQSMVLAERLRSACPGLRLEVDCSGGGIKAQFKRADRSGAALALILGEDEVINEHLGVKPLRQDVPQRTVPWAEFVALLGAATRAGAVDTVLKRLF